MTDKRPKLLHPLDVGARTNDSFDLSDDFVYSLSEIVVSLIEEDCLFVCDLKEELADCLPT